MAELFTFGNLVTLLILTLLQAVLGFDNLLYISLESNRVVKEKRTQVRVVGIALAIVFRLILLFLVVHAIQYFQDPFYEYHWRGYLNIAISVHGALVLFGGAFIVYTAIKEILHLLSEDDLHTQKDATPTSPAKAMLWIVIMNLVFSFDSILSAIALTDVFVVMASAVVISGVLMIILADRVARFLEKNRVFQVLGLFVLLVVGIMLLSEGGHLAKLAFFGFEVHPMTKTTFYFVLVVMVIVDVVQSKYLAKLNKTLASKSAAAGTEKSADA